MKAALKIAQSSYTNAQLKTDRVLTPATLNLVRFIRKVNQQVKDRLHRDNEIGDDMDDNSVDIEICELFNRMKTDWDKYIRQHTYDMYLYTVSLYPRFIQCIVAKDQGKGANDVKETTYELCVTAVSREGDTIQYINIPEMLTEELYELAVANEGQALLYILDPSLNVILRAIYSNPEIILQTRIDLMTHLMALMAVVRDGSLLQHLIGIRSLLGFEISKDMIDKATYNNPEQIVHLSYLPHIQDDTIFLNRIYLRSVFRKPEVYHALPEEYRTAQMAYFMVYNYAHNVMFLPEQQRKLLYKTAVMLDPTVLMKIPIHEITQDICNIALDRNIIIEVIFNAYPSDRRSDAHRQELQKHLENILQYVPIEFRTRNICLTAYILNQDSIDLIPLEHQAYCRGILSY